MSSSLLELRSLSKHYGAFAANQDISLCVEKASIHAIIGENGAGKSTLMKLLFGLEHPTSGSVIWKGEEVFFKSPQQAKKAGIGMVHQHFMQAEHMTALQHLALEMSARVSFWKRLFPIPWSRLRKEAKELAERYQMHIPWEKAVCDLTVIEQQRLEILNVLSENVDLLILDEPTAVLSPLEIKPFLDRLLELKKSGKSIIMISHKLKEVCAVADTVSVIRRGKLVWSGPTSEKTESDLACLMIGANLSDRSSTDSSVRASSQASEADILAVDLKDVRQAHKLDQTLFDNLNLNIKAGEIVGFAGVEGNGQGELTELMLFPHKFVDKGGSKINFKGKDGEPADLLKLTSLEIRKKGMAWVPPDRHQQAVILPMRASENMALGHQNDSRYCQNSKISQLMNWQRTKEDLRRVVERFDVRPAEGDLKMSEYSGGNQQKIVVGREFESSPKLLIAEHPTRGVDLAAAVRIHDSFRELKTKGSAVILISADLDELTQVCDRILVFCRNHIQAEFTRGDFNIERIGKAMAGLS